MEKVPKTPKPQNPKTPVALSVDFEVNNFYILLKISASLLLFLTATAALLLLAFGAADLGEFDELLDLHLLLDSRILEVLFPLGLDLGFA